MRLGRDVAALELEAVEQEQRYHERLLALYQPGSSFRIEKAACVAE
jgi:hypothetical protein